MTGSLCNIYQSLLLFSLFSKTGVFNWWTTVWLQTQQSSPSVSKWGSGPPRVLWRLTPGLWLFLLQCWRIIITNIKVLSVFREPQHQSQLRCNVFYWWNVQQRKKYRNNIYDISSQEDCGIYFTAKGVSSYKKLANRCNKLKTGHRSVF